MSTAMCASGLFRFDSCCFVLLKIQSLTIFVNLGTRVAQKCGSDAKYFSAIDECIPLSIVSSTQTFLDTFLLTSPCTGGEMATQAQIEGMRYCNIVYGGLNITLNDLSADFSAFFDITTLLGLEMAGRNFVSNYCI